jgi:hypothetical protein
MDGLDEFSAQKKLSKRLLVCQVAASHSPVVKTWILVIVLFTGQSGNAAFDVSERNHIPMPYLRLDYGIWRLSYFPPLPLLQMYGGRQI